MYHSVTPLNGAAYGGRFPVMSWPWKNLLFHYSPYEIAKFGEVQNWMGNLEKYAIHYPSPLLFTHTHTAQWLHQARSIPTRWGRAKKQRLVRDKVQTCAIRFPPQTKKKLAALSTKYNFPFFSITYKTVLMELLIMLRQPCSNGEKNVFLCLLFSGKDPPKIWMYQGQLC